MIYIFLIFASRNRKFFAFASSVKHAHSSIALSGIIKAPMMLLIRNRIYLNFILTYSEFTNAAVTQIRLSMFIHDINAVIDLKYRIHSHTRHNFAFLYVSGVIFVSRIFWRSPPPDSVSVIGKINKTKITPNEQACVRMYAQTSEIIICKIFLTDSFHEEGFRVGFVHLLLIRVRECRRVIIFIVR